MLKFVYLVAWDEIAEEASVMIADKKGTDLVLPIDCTDDELVSFVRKTNDDEEDPDFPWGKDWLGRDNTWGWRCAAVTRGPHQAVIEWRSDRNHFASTTVLWVG